MSLWWLWLALAFAEEPSCAEVALPDAPEAMSVAWVSPVAKRVGRNGTVQVVSTAALRSWVAREGEGSIARMLQQLGLRSRAAEPKKRWKVVVFDVVSQDLCRPVVGHEEPVNLAGVVSCSERASQPDRTQGGCGYTTDRATGEMGMEVFQGRWAELARNGFCVLPAERFVQ